MTIQDMADALYTEFGFAPHEIGGMTNGQISEVYQACSLELMPAS